MLVNLKTVIIYKLYCSNLPWYFNPRKCRYCRKLLGIFITLKCTFHSKKVYNSFISLYTSSTVVEHSTHNAEIKGLNPATVTWEDKIAKKRFIRLILGWDLDFKQYEPKLIILMDVLSLCIIGILMIYFVPIMRLHGGILKWN